MKKKAAVISGTTRKVSQGNGPIKGIVVEKHTRSVPTGQFLKVVNTLKPMSRQGSISMAQARKAVQDYVRTK